MLDWFPLRIGNFLVAIHTVVPECWIVWSAGADGYPRFSSPWDISEAAKLLPSRGDAYSAAHDFARSTR